MVIDGGFLELFDLRMATNIPTSIPQICAKLQLALPKTRSPSTGLQQALRCLGMWWLAQI
jgi:hypothetical protein